MHISTTVIIHRHRVINEKTGMILQLPRDWLRFSIELAVCENYMGACTFVIIMHTQMR